jgi:hypothetical protein
MRKRGNDQDQPTPGVSVETNKEQQMLSHQQDLPANDFDREQQTLEALTLKCGGCFAPVTKATVGARITMRGQYVDVECPDCAARHDEWTRLDDEAREAAERAGGEFLPDDHNFYGMQHTFDLGLVFENWPEALNTAMACMRQHMIVFLEFDQVARLWCTEKDRAKVASAYTFVTGRATKITPSN